MRACVRFCVLARARARAFLRGLRPKQNAEVVCVCVCVCVKKEGKGEVDRPWVAEKAE